MKRLLMLLCLIPLLVMPVRALDYTAPEPSGVADELMPAKDETFGEGLWKILRQGISTFVPLLKNTAATFASVMAIMLLTALLRSFPGPAADALELAASVAIGMLLVTGSGSLIRLATDTITQLSEYGKLLLPVLTGVLASQGGTTTATALYAGTAAFDAVLIGLIRNVLVPGVSMYLVIGIASAATGEGGLAQLKGFLKWLPSWLLKGILYLFTGYMAITGAVSGSADAATIKAAKLTISSMVPVVGGILSDASESILVSVGVMKNAAGLYGIFALLAIFLNPFLKIGIHYFILKSIAAICGVFGVKTIVDLVEDFSVAMGLLLAMTGVTCLLLLISTVCFMKGIG